MPERWGRKHNVLELPRAIACFSLGFQQNPSFHPYLMGNYRLSEQEIHTMTGDLFREQYSCLMNKIRVRIAAAGTRSCHNVLHNGSGTIMATPGSPWSINRNRSWDACSPAHDGCNATLPCIIL